jgi:hypothetical protein
LFSDICKSLYQGLVELDSNFEELEDVLDDEIQFSYENYVEWENSGRKDLQIGANRLSNRQLFWVAYARRYYRKYHNEIVPEDFEPEQRLQQKYFHVWIKSKSDFQEAFNCNMTKDEENLFDEFLQKYEKLQFEL